MSTAKRTARSRSRSDAADTPSTKRSDAAAEDTPFSPQASSLEFLPDSQLPNGQELARLNGLIHGDVKEDVSGRTIQCQDVTSILQILDKRCQFLDTVSYGRSLRADDQALDHFVRIAQAAFQQEDYSRLMLIKGLWRSPEAVVESSSSGSLDRAPNHDATIEGWKAPFLGSADRTLIKNIRKMYKNAIKRPPGCEYMAHASILQSSGSGKSRLVDQVAETIFTIPFNIREKSNTASGAWPPADHAIRDLLEGWAAKGGERRLRARYLSFFAAVFDEVRKEVERLPQGPASEVNIASAWREHLGDEDFKQHRNTLYSRVVNSSVVQETNAIRKIKSKKMESFLTTAKDALKQLLHAVCAHHTGCMSHADNGKTRPINKIHVLIYFDEAHTLAARQGLPESPPGSKGKTALDVLFSVLNDFCDLGLFTIFLSTQSHLESLAPPASLARSARYRNSMPYMHAPITETPFDSCFVDHPVIPSRLCAGDVSNIEFMACFGRPLWRSQLLPFASQALQRTMWGAAPDSSSPATPLSADHKSRRCQELVALAGSKLVCQPNLHRPRSDFCQAAQTAVLDVRIILSFEPRHAGAHRHQMELVASHLRTVYSVPPDRERIRSGYSSEPILAEAAARQLDHWRKLETTRLGRPMEPAALILQANLDHDLLDRGETGEAVGRLLLILARDHAARALTTSEPLFSRAVPVNTFIKALFPPAIAQRVLESKPENLLQSNDMTFEKAFKGAVLNFTHFAKWADDSALCPDAAVGCFVRSMAVICRNNPPAVDAFIPVLLDQSAKLCPEVMTGILIQFKRRKTKGTKGAYAIDEKNVGLFDSESTLVGGRAASHSTRPHITLVMELGVPESPSSHAGAGPIDATRSSSFKVPIPVVVGHPPERASDRLANAGTVQPEHPGTVQPERDAGTVRQPEHPGTVPRKHPRYSIIVYGCSSSAYQVIGEEDSLIYKQILRKSDGVLEGHQRQDTRSLNMVRRLKPAFSLRDASWEWAAAGRTDMQPEYSNEDEDSDKDTDGMQP